MYKYNATYVSNYDGDTIKFIVDVGFHTLRKITVRLLGINTPEIRGGNITSKVKAKMVRDIVHKKLKEAKSIVVTTQKDKRGSFSRYLAKVVVDGEDLSEFLLRNNYAEVYKKK